MARQREALERGDTPPDFPNIGIEKGVACMTGQEALSELGRRQMGFEPWEEAHFTGGGEWGKGSMLQECNDILFGEGANAGVQRVGKKKKR